MSLTEVARCPSSSGTSEGEHCMKIRTSLLPALVVVAVVALVLGSFGIATAAGITKGHGQEDRHQGGQLEGLHRIGGPRPSR
jgi:hypothetical protein